MGDLGKKRKTKNDRAPRIDVDTISHRHYITRQARSRKGDQTMLENKDKPQSQTITWYMATKVRQL